MNAHGGQSPRLRSDGLAAYREQLAKALARPAVSMDSPEANPDARMSDLAKSLREKLAATRRSAPSLITEQASADGTVKWLFDV
jgi:23S rRNA (adenine2503-C2)-methyltransferase